MHILTNSHIDTALKYTLYRMKIDWCMNTKDTL